MRNNFVDCAYIFNGVCLLFHIQQSETFFNYVISSIVSLLQQAHIAIYHSTE